MSFLGDFIRGEFVKPSQLNGVIKKLNPARPRETIFDGGFRFDHVQLACDSAKKAFKEWSHLPLDNRITSVQKIKELLAAHSNELAKLITIEVGKPLWEAQREVQGAIRNIDVTIEEALPLITKRDSKRGSWRYKPRGVLAVISPFNFPVYLPTSHIIPALLTGNTVVFKPSELTPATGQFLATLIEKSALPAGVFNMVQGHGEVGRRLVMNQNVEGVLFTGSYESGFKIKQDTLTHFWKILALEMGGKNASIVWDDGPFEKSIYECLVGAFLTAGQRCTSTSRIIVRKSIYEKFIDRFHSCAKNLTVDDPIKNPFMGPLITAESQDRYLRFQNIAQRELAEPLMRGRAIELESGGYFVSPSINLVRKHDPDSVYQKTEVFGPNVAIYSVEEIDDALNIVNSSSYGLSLSIFSNDIKIYEKCLMSSRVGLLHWNRSTVTSSPHIPFGGMGKSGNNQPAGLFSVLTATYPVATIEDHNPDLEPDSVFPGMNFK